MARIFVLVVLVVVASLCGDNNKQSNSVNCSDEDLTVGCVVGNCRLSAPRGTLGADRKLTLSFVPLPSELSGDALGNSLCTISLPSDRENVADFDLALHSETFQARLNPARLP